MLKIDRDLCTGCGNCVDMCPFGALSIKNGKAVVEENICRLCGVCMNACAFGAMSMVDDAQPVVDAETDAAGRHAQQSEAAPDTVQPEPRFPGQGFGRGMGRGLGRGMGRGPGRGRGGMGKGMGRGRNRW